MKKIFWLTICLFLTVGAAFAQNTGSITATVKDATTNETVSGAVVELANVKSEAKQYFTSGYKGVIDIKNLAAGEYAMAITFLGYKEYRQTVKVGKGVLDLGTIQLQQDAKVIESIEVSAYMRTSQKGDTVSYNASAFKTSRDASAESLLSKMPGITVNNDGSVDAQGESVQRVFVDGKEFFGQDVSTTIKTIPAEMVSKVEVYNKLSDKAEFTGLDDGEGYKAINIITTLDKRSGQFGKVYGSYGIPDKYIVGGNVNIFNGDQKISIIGLANNLNQTNFSFDDIVGATSSGSTSSSSGGGGGMRSRMGAARNFLVRPQDGISTVQSLGLNYANSWKKLELQGSYFFNHTSNANTQLIDRITYGSDDYTELYNARTNSTADNYNNRLSTRLDYTINDSQSIRIRAELGLQNYKNASDGRDTTVNGLTGTTLKEMRQQTEGTSKGSYGNISALYRAKLGKPGRTITVNSSINWNNTDSYSNPRYTIYVPTDSTYYRIVDYLSNSNRVRAEFTYTEPINAQSQLALEYEYSYRFSDQNKNTTVTINGVDDTALGNLLSNISQSGYTTHEVGPGYNFSNDKVRLSMDVKYQYSTLSSDQTLPTDINVGYKFNNVVYRGMANINFDKANALRIMARSETANPSISQLQDAITVSGNSYEAGNPNLQPSYTHSLMSFYTNTDISSGRTIMLMGGAMVSTNSIISRTVMNSPSYVIPNYNGRLLGAGNTYSTYENLSSTKDWKAMVNASYGFPIKALKSNFTLNLSGSFVQSPSMINDYLNIMKGQYYSGGVQIGSNISENLDFTLSYNASYNINDNTSELASQINRYFSQYAKAEFKWITWKGITLTANGTYSQYKGITTAYNEEILLCNAYIGKKIFKNQRGELSIGINDIFNQNRDFNRSVGTNYIQNTTNSAIGRYAAIQFVYNLRVFGKGSSSKDFDNIDGASKEGVGMQRSDNRPRGMMGPPPGGGPR